VIPWSRLICLLILFAALSAAETKRVVIIKIDGVPHDVLERELARVNPATGKSSLPWMERVFAQDGTRMANFYVRAISLSAPSWSLLDTGHHLQIRGNAEFDRYTHHVYDYLNFFPFYLSYALSHEVDMPGVEVLDELGIPLLMDRFAYQNTYQSFQLYQRGVRWKTLKGGLEHHFSRSPRDLLDEWTMGFEVGSSVEEQEERELIASLGNPRIQYLDYFTGDYDHVAHLTPDVASQRLALQRIDGLIGRVWTAIQSTPEFPNTALIVVSDHGMNTVPGIYSQGYNLVDFFASRAGGAHHVVTDRHPMTEYKLKGLDPFVSDVITPSEESLYLKGEAHDYPTALLDLDGNERASVYLRNSDLNALHILLEDLGRAGIAAGARRVKVDAFLEIIHRHRAEWQATLDQLREELVALGRSIAEQKAQVAAEPKHWSAAQREQGLDKVARRLAFNLEARANQERRYSDYATSLAKLLAMSRTELEKHVPAIGEVIPKRAMGEANTVRDLQSYIIGPAANGGFATVNYFPLLAGIAVRNNVQPEVGSRPVDFIATRLPDDSVWLYGDENHQAIVFSRRDAAGALELRYLAMRCLRQRADGSVEYEPAELGAGFPLRLWEDRNLGVAESERDAWFAAWHSDVDWLRAVHKTRYSDGIIGLQEQFQREPVRAGLTGDAKLLARFEARRRRLAEPDFIIFANDHWNFNVRGFNPGGNHGALLRISTHSVLMFAGGESTGIPQHLVVDEPYDSLSFVPSVLDLMGMREDAARLPGRAIREILK